MSLTHGSTALVEGSLPKGLPIMMLGGVLAWVAGQVWSGRADGALVFQLIMVYGTLATVTVPAQLVAGRRARPWLMATMGAVGLGVPWLFALAVEREGQGVALQTTLVTVGGWVLVYAVSWATRYVLRRSQRA